MPILRFVASISSAAAVALAPAAAPAQSYPNKAIRIVTAEPGGGADFVARLLAQGIAGALGQQVIVDNRGGAGVIAAEIVAKATADGYTLLFIGSSLWLAPFLRSGVPYDPVRDFAPIAIVSTTPNILVLNPALPPKSVRELIAFAKAKPGELNYASGPAGSSNHLAAELFKAMAGVNLTRITYKGSGPALNDLIAGQVQLMFPNGAAVMPHVKSGRLRALAVTSAQPSALVPGLPTVSAAGLPGYEFATIQGLSAPAKTPSAIINRLNQQVLRFVGRPDARERFFNGGVEAVGSTPAQFAAQIKSEMKTLGKVITDAGIREE